MVRFCTKMKKLIETANEFGAQAIVACVDYLIEDNVVHIMTDLGVAKTHTDFYVYLKKLEDNGVGEIMPELCVERWHCKRF